MTREWWIAYWRLRAQQERIEREYLAPLSKLLFEKVLEAHPELRLDQQQGSTE